MRQSRFSEEQIIAISVDDDDKQAVRHASSSCTLLRSTCPLMQNGLGSTAPL